MQQPVGDEEGGFRQSSRGDGLPFKRGHRGEEEEEKERRFDHKVRPRSHHHHIRGRRGERLDRLLCSFQSRRRSVALFTGIAAVAVVFILVETFMLQRTLVGRSSTFGRFGREWNMIVGEPSKYLSSATRFVVGKDLKFEPGSFQDRLARRRRLHPTEEHSKFGIRPPRLAIVLGGDELVPSTLKLLSIANGLKFLGYKLMVYAVKEAGMHKLWEKIGCQVLVLDLDIADNFDWSNFEGIILSSLEAKTVVSHLMQEPFSSTPLVWIVEDGILGRRLMLYEEAGWKKLVVEWRTAFSRADAIVFPNFRFPLLYNKFDSGNFFVIPGSPVDVLAAEKYLKSHSRDQLRAKNGFHESDLVVTLIGSSLFYNGLPLDYSLAMHSISPLLMKLGRTDDMKGPYKFIFLSGNSSGGINDAFQEIASNLGLPNGYIRHYGMDVDVDGVLLMSNIVLYGSIQDEQDFPPLLIRAMTFKIPIVAPNLTVINKYVSLDSFGIGQPLRIYEIYWGQGAWKFLHHGSLYRGLSLSSSTRRLVSDDVDAVGRLPFLNNTHFRDLLCETGGLFSIANHVDDIHKIPWIGFQSWRATGRKVSLSAEAEQVLEKCINTEPRGHVIYFWARSDIDNPLFDVQKNIDFWFMCDVLNGGNCRHLFEKAFRHMYGLPLNVTALPPMPFDGGYWSILHSWAMPTHSFMEFVIFSRMFTSSLDVQSHEPGRNWTCLLGTSEMEKKHCYCHVLELLVNVWAYHSARKMVYINPKSGVLEEQHPIGERDGLMWAKYFNFTILKAMDEDLAEEADDGDHPNDRWLWPLTGEMFWQGIHEREREERYRQKMEKKKRVKEKLLERQKHGYKQKSLG